VVARTFPCSERIFATAKRRNTTAQHEDFCLKYWE
jgi:hypothetical protein